MPNQPRSNAASPPGLSALATRGRLTSTALVFTLLGDIVWPLGKPVWLGDLIKLAAGFGLTDRLVRTSVFRLSRENLVRSQTRGRRAYYELSPAGWDLFARSPAALYAAQPAPWNGSWRLVQMLPGLSQKQRRDITRMLKSQGFGQVGPRLFAHPRMTAKRLADQLDGIGARGNVLAFSAVLDDFVASEAVAKVVSDAWDLTTINARYHTVLERYRVLEELLAAEPWPDDATCFRLRVLLIHDWRAAVIADPHLPESFMPSPWHAIDARTLCAKLYKQLTAPCERHIAGQLKIDGGFEWRPAYRDRFRNGPH